MSFRKIAKSGTLLIDNRYYVDRGFQIMGSFEDSQPGDVVPWTGKLLRIDLP